MHPRLIFVLLLASSTQIFARSQPGLAYSIRKSDRGEYRVVGPYAADLLRGHSFANNEDIATAIYQDSYAETGWDTLEMTTSEQYNDMDQAFAAGYLEGSITHNSIYMHWYNMLSDYCANREDICNEVREFSKENMKWVKESIENLADDSEYWYQVKLYYEQLRGLAAGYQNANQNKSRSLTYDDIFWMNFADLDDLMVVMKAKARNFTDDSCSMIQSEGNLRCSALIKVLQKELYVAHVTWSEYKSMLRFLKKYNFSYHRSPTSSYLVPGRAMSFSSYPGVISSGDDFYVISSGLVTLETTIGNGNVSLWRNVKAVGQVSEAARHMIANRLAKTGKAWAKIFAKYNSGTYNNQWMVVDYKKYRKGSLQFELPPGLLWVVEQLPGHIQAADKTSILNSQGYWPSYNTAYFTDIYDISGSPELVKKFGDWFTYDKNPRALMFKRDQGKVSDLQSMLNLMRYNDFKNDPLSRCNCTPPYSAENAISARNDLNPKEGKYPFPALGHRSHGATDAKVTSLAMYKSNLEFLAVSGPAYNLAGNIPPFQWSATDFNANTRHVGHPDLWKFEPLVHKWSSHY